MVAINQAVSPKVAAMTQELFSLDDGPPPAHTPRPQDPNATLQTHVEQHRGVNDNYDVFTAKTVSADGKSTTIRVDGSKQRVDEDSVEITDGDGDHVSVRWDGTATLDGHGKQGRQQLTPGTVVRVGDATLRFNFDYPPSDLLGLKDRADPSHSKAVLTSIEIMTGNAACNDTAAPVVKTVNVSSNNYGSSDERIIGELYVLGDKSPHWATPNPDENDASSSNNALCSAPALFEDADQRIMNRNPVLELGPGALFALPQVGTYGGKLEPGALTLERGGTIDNRFTSVLDTSKIDSSQQLP